MSEKDSLHSSILKIRVELQQKKLKQSGHNKFQGFKYFELSDFLPSLNELLLKHEVFEQITFDNEKVSLTLSKGSSSVKYELPYVLSEFKGMNNIQKLGATNTYTKRYLYLNAFGITDGEVVDLLPQNLPNTSKPKKKITLEKVAVAVKYAKDNNYSLSKFFEEYEMDDKTEEIFVQEFQKPLV